MSTTRDAEAAQTAYRYGVRDPGTSTSGSTSRAYSAEGAVKMLINDMTTHLRSACTCGGGTGRRSAVPAARRCDICKAFTAALARLQQSAARLVPFAGKEWFYYPELPVTDGQAAPCYSDRNGTITLICLTGSRRVDGGDGPENVTEAILRVDTGARRGVRLYLAAHRRTPGGWTHATPLMPPASFHHWDGNPRYTDCTFYEPAISGWLDQVAASDPTRIGDFTDPISTIRNRAWAQH